MSRKFDMSLRSNSNFNDTQSAHTRVERKKKTRIINEFIADFSSSSSSLFTVQ